MAKSRSRGSDPSLFDSTPDQLRESTDPRVKQFIEGEARDRLVYLVEARPGLRLNPGQPVDVEPLS